MLTLLAAFHHVPIPDNLWDKVGDHLAGLRRSGVAVPFPDVVIATLGIENQIEVWARDSHFPTMQKQLPGLKLYQEPP